MRACGSNEECHVESMQEGLQYTVHQSGRYTLALLYSQRHRPCA